MAEEFIKCVKTTGYHYKTLYNVYMANGNKATEIIHECNSRGYHPNILLLISENRSIEEGEKQFKEFKFEVSNRFRCKEDKLPRKLRNGW